MLFKNNTSNHLTMLQDEHILKMKFQWGHLQIFANCVKKHGSRTFLKNTKLYYLSDMRLV
jgi:hypothetical protein